MSDLAGSSQVRLRPALPEDRFLIRRWLGSPDIQWGNAASAEAEITLAMESSAALPRLIERQGAAIGYAQAADIELWAERAPDGVPAGAWQVGFFFGPPAISDVDLGCAVLQLLTGEVFATTLAVACSAVVSIRTEAVVRSYERADFRWLRVVPDPLLGPCWLMLKERPGSTPSR